jgi:hypothetical protein
VLETQARLAITTTLIEAEIMLLAKTWAERVINFTKAAASKSKEGVQEFDDAIGDFGHAMHCITNIFDWHEISSYIDQSMDELKKGFADEFLAFLDADIAARYADAWTGLLELSVFFAEMRHINK